jgi:hypothetical protein
VQSQASEHVAEPAGRLDRGVAHEDLVSRHTVTTPFGWRTKGGREGEQSPRALDATVSLPARLKYPCERTIGCR